MEQEIGIGAADDYLDRCRGAEYREVVRTRRPHTPELVMEKPMVELAQRLERLEQENRRWKCVAGVTALGLTLSLTLGGLFGSCAVVAQQPEEKPGKPALRRMEYKVINVGYLNRIEKPLQDMDAEGWELVQVVPTGWTTSGQGLAGTFNQGIMVARRPMMPSK
jgi:hypothetical protein